MLQYIYPARSLYSYVGKSILDGRQVTELLVKEGISGPHGHTGARVFLDEATYLPYRHVGAPSGGDFADLPTLERTFTRLEINTAVSDNDFSPELSQDAVRIYEPWHRDKLFTMIPAFSEAQKTAGYVVFAPSTGGNGPRIVYMVEKDGKQSPILSAMTSSYTEIRQGIYVPLADDNERASHAFNTELGQWPMTKISIDGQPAEWRAHTLGSGRVVLRFTREGTQIEIVASTIVEATAMARDLRPVREMWPITP